MVVLLTFFVTNVNKYIILVVMLFDGTCYICMMVFVLHYEVLAFRDPA